MHNLNPQQLAAVTYLASPLLVIAGAGSGKTGVITQKIAYLVQEHHHEPKNIFAVTFTNKAAREMNERARALLGRRGRGLNISTFHRLGLEMLRQEVANVGLRPHFSIFDARDGANLLKELARLEDDDEVKALQTRISLYKNGNLSPEQAINGAGNDDDRRAAIIYQKYNERLRAYNAVDFDDLIALPLHLLKEDAALRARWQNKIAYLLVDEYQDTNRCQYQLMQFLTGDAARFTAVGDDDQSIYAWRGAQPENLTMLHDDYPQLKTIKLEQNYRCHQQILQAANQVIAHNPHLVEKKLWSSLSQGEGVIVQSSKNEDEEAGNVITDINCRQMLSGRPFSDFAILYRSNFQARVLEVVLRERGMPYTISGGTSFFDHSEIRDLISYLRLINNPADDAAFLRVINTPKREIGAVTLTKLGEYAAQRHLPLFVAAGEVGLQQTLDAKAYQHLQIFISWVTSMQDEAQNALPTEILKAVLHDIDYDEHLYELHKTPQKIELRQKRLGQLMAWLTRLESEEGYDRLETLMQYLMLLDILDKQEKKENAVQLMTLHSAKGLEFPIVYIVGCEEDLLPHRNANGEIGIEEERRLCYVGMTRAKETLFLSYARQRRNGKTREEVEPSRFLDELPLDSVDWRDGRVPRDPAAEAAKNQQFLEDMIAMLNNS